MLDAGVLRIEKHDDRLVFRNPGLLMLPVADIFEGGLSKARNPRMQNILRMVGYGENLGSGFPMILNAWRQADWGEPTLVNRVEVDEVALTLPINRFGARDPKSDPKNQQSDPKSDPKKLSPQARHDMAIALMRNNPQITREEIAEVMGVGRTTILKDLRILKERYGVHYEGSSKTGRWVIDKE